MRKKLRKIVIFTIKLCYKKLSWKLLKILPQSYPESSQLNNWNSSLWSDYHAWLQKHSPTQIDQLKKYRQEIENWNNFPSFSLVTPVYNTPDPILTETILSVLQQCYPYWQLCIVDDGSTSQETIDTLNPFLMQDPRIDIHHNNLSQGISNASNKAISMAKGQYIVFLDHDDRLSPDALYSLAKEIKKNPDTDILYSDRDMIDTNGFRHSHFFKPGWSPETLLSGNYAFHLVCYRYVFLKKIGPLKKKFDGSQDYDLLLRAAEHEPVVTHIPKVLYSWRQLETSTAHQPELKEYVFKAGIAALEAALRRRNLKGRVFEDTTLWRGHYHADLEAPKGNEIHIIIYTPESRSREIIHRIKLLPKSGYLVFLSSGLKTPSKQSISKLVAPLSLKKIAIITGKIITADKKLFHSGLVFTDEGKIFSPYRNFPETEPGYMEIPQITHNVPLPHPACFAIKHEIYQLLGGFKPDYSIEMAILNLALKAKQKNWRILYNPKADFTLEGKTNSEFGSILEENHFRQKLKKHYPNGDPYFNPNLRVKHDSDNNQIFLTI